MQTWENWICFPVNSVQLSEPTSNIRSNCNGSCCVFFEGSRRPLILCNCVLLLLIFFFCLLHRRYSKYDLPEAHKSMDFERAWLSSASQKKSHISLLFDGLHFIDLYTEHMDWLPFCLDSLRGQAWESYEMGFHVVKGFIREWWQIPTLYFVALYLSLSGIIR